jgi:hypothetical protein
LIPFSKTRINFTVELHTSVCLPAAITSFHFWVPPIQASIDLKSCNTKYWEVWKQRSKALHRMGFCRLHRGVCTLSVCFIFSLAK